MSTGPGSSPSMGRWLRSVVASVGAAILVFIFLGVAVHGRGHLALDDALVRSLRDGDTGRPIGPVWLPAVMRDITALGSSAVLVGLLGLSAGYLAVRRRYGAALLVMIAASSGYGLNTWLKHEFGRTRPDVALRLLEIDTPSFPSGHATASAVAYVILVALLTRSLPRRRERVYVTVAGGLVTFAVGVTRVYLGVHYPSDVLAGWAVGLIWAALCYSVARLLERQGVGAPEFW